MVTSDKPSPAEEPSDVDTSTGASRRSFLSGAGAAALTGLAVSACSADEAPPIAAPILAPTPPPAVPSEPAQALPVPFASEVQQGVLLPAAAAGLVASFDVVIGDRSELAATMQALSAEVERLMSGEPLAPADEFLPPSDSGAIGNETGTAGIAVTISVGASLFDQRFGLADLRPAELIPMPRFFNDRLVNDQISHGDISLTISAPTQQAAVFALHQVVRVTEQRLRVRWVQEGYNQLLPESAGTIAHTRNLMGFRDGTSNLDTADDALMQEHVWVQPEDAEPDWAAGGTYQAVRTIRMLIEFWATAALVRQEQIFGRHRDTGAPLGQTSEGEVPSFASDLSDETIPRRSHMRLANPRTPGSARILRRGFSYLNGADVNGTLDQGLLFICFQRSLSRGFLEVQSRLDGEPLEDYIKPVGGGLYFILPGPGPSGSGWVGESLFNS